MSLDLLRDKAGESRVVRRRLLVAGIAVLLLMGLLAGRIAMLQVAGYQHYASLSQENRVRIAPAEPTRGLIYDRDGRLLAENVPAFRLTVIPEQVEDMDALLTGLQEIVELSATDIERFRDLRERQRRFQEIPLKLRLSESEVARLAVNRHRFPGVEVKAHLTRFYPYGAIGSHAIGYVGRISEQELRQVDASQYRGSSVIGKSGVERFYEERLHGEMGLVRLETNALGRTLRTLERDPPVPGEDLHLTLDIELQRVAETALGEHSGAVVAIDPRDGAVLALASQPGFDPNLFVTGITLEDFRGLQSQPGTPMFNRALRGRYPPGSVIKPFLGLAAAAHGTVDPDEEFQCNGLYRLPNVSRPWRDWKRGGHGEIDLTQAIAQSCDIYFYDLAYEMGIDAMHEWMTGFGFGRPSGIDLPGELTGVMPSREWKRTNRGEPWYHGETVNTGIGQGYMLATPVQLAASTAMLANAGRPVRPHLVAATEAPGEDSASRLAPAEPLVAPVTLQNPALWEEAIGGMAEVMHGRRGTARAVAEDMPYRMAGKTGTAQVFGLAPDEEYDEDEIPRELRDHALFIAFAPVGAPRIAVAVIAEHGGSGSGTAAPIARQVIDAWLLEQGELPDVAADVGER
ncbi:penicillin-binding protein 2 [Sediminicurvatus halobius]|uniref:Peptidoglycan D,D-transpeptidase MrdA n=1 Tax=Sediminicurvatus halobius TaxID=2182432 RepID=A0A2U2N805_9GAMM|nr:penicillin-binding protein 2 [Spiribacter halobius]PWG65238.1 penicillin-binding protein 2 [Spiribacter halobius]UEX78807.1 penicillin-binding protein 2 [Spiribacter halobius]